MKPKKPTKASLADKLGISRQLLAAHLKDPTAPKLDDVPGWVAFLAEKGRIGTAPAELRKKIAEARLAILKETKIRLEHDNKVRQGELMPVAEAKRQASEACGYLFSELERAERELPPSLAGATAVDIAKRLHGFNEAVRTEAKQKFERIGE